MNYDVFLVFEGNFSAEYNYKRILKYFNEIKN